MSSRSHSLSPSPVSIVTGREHETISQQKSTSSCRWLSLSLNAFKSRDHIGLAIDQWLRSSDNYTPLEEIDRNQTTSSGWARLRLVDWYYAWYALPLLASFDLFRYSGTMVSSWQKKRIHQLRQADHVQAEISTPVPRVVRFLLSPSPLVTICYPNVFLYSNLYRSTAAATQKPTTHHYLIRRRDRHGSTHMTRLVFWVKL